MCELTDKATKKSDKGGDKKANKLLQKAAEQRADIWKVRAGWPCWGRGKGRAKRHHFVQNNKSDVVLSTGLKGGKGEGGGGEA